MSISLAGGSARTIGEQVRRGERSAREVCLEHLALVEAGALLGAMWHVDADGALEQADAVDAVRARGGALGPLAGVPVVVKDAFAVRGMPGGGGGQVITAGRDAVAVDVLRCAGAVVLGKAAMHQLGWGTSGQTPGRLACRNPRDPGLQPGGSSSGSAVAVGAGLVPLALGADSAGSIRIPAAWCGVVGYKPERRIVDRTGLLPLSPQLDAAGWMAGCVDDCRLVAEVFGETSPGDGRESLRVVVDAAAMATSGPAVASAVEQAIERLHGSGLVIEPRELALPRVSLGTVFAADLADAWAAQVTRDPDRYGEDVREGIAAGLRVPEHEAGAARRRIAEVRAAVDAAARRGDTPDAIIGPTVPLGPALLDEGDDVAVRTRHTRVFNVLDWPAITVPCPGHPETGLQIAVPRRRTGILWRVAAALCDGSFAS